MTNAIRHGLMGLALLTCTCAGAAEVGISPTRAVLTPKQRVETLTLRNPGSEPVDYQVSVKRWRMAAGGKWVFEEVGAEDGLIVFPLGFHVLPGKAQLVRVGVAKTAALAGPESSYRIFICEMPKEKKTGEPLALSILSQLSLPVFVHEGDATPTISLQAGEIRKRQWTFEVAANGGHLDPKKAKLRLLDAAGKPLLEQDVQVGYVLHGASLPVTVALSVAACSRAARYELVADAPLGTQQGTLPSGIQRTCGG